MYHPESSLFTNIYSIIISTTLNCICVNVLKSDGYDCTSGKAACDVNMLLTELKQSESDWPVIFSTSTETLNPVESALHCCTYSSPIHSNKP